MWPSSKQLLDIIREIITGALVYYGLRNGVRVYRQQIVRLRRRREHESQWLAHLAVVATLYHVPFAEMHNLQRSFRSHYLKFFRIEWLRTLRKPQ